MAVNTDMIPYREGGYNTTPRKLPGQSNFSPISLSRGCIMGTSQMWNWFREIFSATQGGGRGRAGNNFRQDFTIKLLDHPVTLGPTPVKMQWKVYNAWPTVLQYSTLDAGGNGLEIEQMTLEHEGWELQWASASPGASL
jgi:phage tail-like protein